MEKHTNAELYKKGIAAYKAKKYDVAITLLENIPAGNEHYRYAQTFVARSHLRLGNADAAATAFLEAKKTVPDILKTYYNHKFSGIDNTTSFVLQVASFMLDKGKNNFFSKTLSKYKVYKTNSEYKKYKGIYLKSLLIINKLQIKEAGELRVAHYTKRTTAAHLLFDRSKFQLGSVTTSNDPQEGKTLLKFLDIEEVDTPNADSNSYQAFIGSFTFNHDSLNQFRLYGKEENMEATGVSIVVKDSFFSKKTGVNLERDYDQDTNSDELLGLYRCIYIDPVTRKVISIGHKEEYILYRDKKTNSALSEGKIAAYKKDIGKRLLSITNDMESLKKELAGNKSLSKELCCELLLSLRYLVKHVAFKEEQECRIIKIENVKANDKIKFTPDYSRMYIDYHAISDDIIDKVYFGPKATGLNLFTNIAKLKKRSFKCIRCIHPLA